MKGKFLKLQSIAWDYNRRHPDRRVQVYESLDLEYPIATFFNFQSHSDMKCTRTMFEYDEIMEELLK